MSSRKVYYRLYLSSVSKRSVASRSIVWGLLWATLSFDSTFSMALFTLFLTAARVGYCELAPFHIPT
jgi:hypothetical protein